LYTTKEQRRTVTTGKVLDMANKCSQRKIKEGMSFKGTIVDMMKIFKRMLTLMLVKSLKMVQNLKIENIKTY
jgi:hypothetical protein